MITIKQGSCHTAITSDYNLELNISSMEYNQTEFQFEIEYILSMKYDYDKTIK